MSWIESHSVSFTARHETEDSEVARALLDRLEAFRIELAEDFRETPIDIGVVIHPRELQLALAHPWLPVARLAAAPAARRYMAGWFSSDEVHVLGPGALRRRASRVPGSLETLRLTPLHEYAHIVVGANNRGLPPPFNPGSFRRYLRWGWLCEGAATHFAGQTKHLRPAIARRLREGQPPVFPPSTRDAPLLGGTIFALLERMDGRRACAALASRLDPAGAEAAIEHAFRDSTANVEREWRRYLTRLTAGQ